jgi:hypothetical protein
MAAFTHYWKNRTWKWHVDDDREGLPLDHTAGNQFRKRGVETGDRIYVVTVLKGKLFLLGRMTVDGFISQAQAMKEVEEGVWDAVEHVVSKKGTAMNFHRQVPDSIVKQLLFLSCPHEDEATGRIAFQERELIFRRKGILDEQTLRGVRRLSPDSARLLDTLITDT